MFWSLGHRLPGGFYGRVGSFSGYSRTGWGYGPVAPPAGTVDPAATRLGFYVGVLAVPLAIFLYVVVMSANH